MGRIRALATFFVASGLVCLAPGRSFAVQQTSKQAVRIAIVSDGPLGRYSGVPADLRQEIGDLLSLDFDVTFVAEPRFTGDWTLAGAQRVLDDALGDPAVDLVLAIGPISSHLLAARASVPKPAVAAFVLAPRLQGIPSQASTGITDLNYLYATREGRDLELFASVSAHRRLALLIPRGLAEAVPDAAEYIGALPQAGGWGWTWYPSASRRPRR